MYLFMFWYSFVLLWAMGKLMCTMLSAQDKRNVIFVCGLYRLFVPEVKIDCDTHIYITITNQYTYTDCIQSIYVAIYYSISIEIKLC